ELPAPKEPTAAERADGAQITPPDTPTPEPALVGAPHTPDTAAAAAHPPTTTPPLRLTTPHDPPHLPHDTPHTPDTTPNHLPQDTHTPPHTPTAAHTPPTRSHQPPAEHTPTDHTPTGGNHTGGNHTPTGNASHTPTGPAGHTPSGPTHDAPHPPLTHDPATPPPHDPTTPDHEPPGTHPDGEPGHPYREILDQQVHRANHDPEYFKKYYRSNGTRKNLDLADETGLTPPQLVRPDGHGPWVAVSDAPPALKPDYLDDGARYGTENLDHHTHDLLNDSAHERQTAIDADTPKHEPLQHLRETLEHNASPEHQSAYEAARAEHTPLHKAMTDASEHYGEMVAAHHAIPEHFDVAEQETLHGPRNGNDQFDQVWRLKDGGYVVVEAKSSLKTDLGARNLPNGQRVSQGTRKYFDDIVRIMEKRGIKEPSELKLAQNLRRALAEGKLHYVVVKGMPEKILEDGKVVGQHAGYSMRTFDISKP
ncbi:hypothetical protein AB0910_30540, partial [Streptomyces sp. NPDC047002]